MAQEMIRVGVLGCGAVATELHLPALRQLADVEVVAVCDVDVERAQRTAQQFGASYSFQQYEDLVALSDIDVVAVLVPPRFHAQLALAALAANKHVFIEKPLAATLDEANAIIAAAQQFDRKVMVGFNLRWHRLVRSAKSLIDDPEFRQGLHLATSSVTSPRRFTETATSWRHRRSDGGGVFFELATHHFDLWRFLMETEIAEVAARSVSDASEDEAALISAQMANGVLVSSVFSYGTAPRHEFSVYSHAGIVSASLYRFDGLRFMSTYEPISGGRFWFNQVAHFLRTLPQGIQTLPQGGEYILSYQHEWQHFLHCIRSDAEVESTLEDGKRSLAAVLQAVKVADKLQVGKVER